MKLRKVNDETYVNVGDGNILHLSAAHHGATTAIVFIGGFTKTLRDLALEDVVRSLEAGDA